MLSNISKWVRRILSSSNGTLCVLQSTCKYVDLFLSATEHVLVSYVITLCPVLVCPAEL